MMDGNGQKPALGALQRLGGPGSLRLRLLNALREILLISLLMPVGIPTSIEIAFI
jgi:hypothetical protein